MTDAERDLQRFEDILKEIGLIRESLNLNSAVEDFDIAA